MGFEGDLCRVVLAVVGDSQFDAVLVHPWDCDWDDGEGSRSVFLEIFALSVSGQGSSNWFIAGSLVVGGVGDG